MKIIDRTSKITVELLNANIADQIDTKLFLLDGVERCENYCKYIDVEFDESLVSERDIVKEINRLLYTMKFKDDKNER